jgi:AraC-like DNA-binding protein
MEIAADYKLFIRRNNGSNNQLIECGVVVPQSRQEEFWNFIQRNREEQQNAVFVLSANNDSTANSFKFALQSEPVNTNRKELTNKIKTTDTTVAIPYYSPDEKLYKEFIGYIKENISNSEMNVDDIVATVGMSRAQLYRRVNNISGQTVKELVRNIRLQSAAKLLQYQDIRVSEVMNMVGFTNRSYFIKCFRERYGRCPSDYKRQIESSCA